METFEISLPDLQPSQLYISADKLAKVERSLQDAPMAGSEPLPVKRLGSRTVLTDGHTRALAAQRAGARSVLATWETDELDWEAYETCVQWCRDEGVHAVADLQARIVPADRYEALWYERCRRLHERLARQRAASTDGGTDPAMTTTPRLDLVPADPDSVDAALDGPDALAACLGASVPATWPPELLDRPALEFMRSHLAEGPEQDGWWLHFVLLRGVGEGRTLVGGAGYKGPPSADGTVEVGYGVVAEHQRRGYATEAVRGLVARAFALPVVRRVIAETYPDHEASIGVLRQCGFRPGGGDGSEPGVIRFELTRAAYTAGRGAE